MHLRASYQRGFSLLEVMIALVVLTVGLLGVVKLETVAYSSTNVANKRSMAALAASSLAASMHVNRGYWGIGTDAPGAVIAINGATVTVALSAPALGAIIGAGQVCTSTTVPCTPVVMAAYDLQKWATSLAALLPNDTGTVACNTATPMSCTINIQWGENVVNINTQQVTTTTTFDNPSYTLFVEP